MPVRYGVALLVNAQGGAPFLKLESLYNDTEVRIILLESKFGDSPDLKNGGEARRRSFDELERYADSTKDFKAARHDARPVTELKLAKWSNNC